MNRPSVHGVISATPVAANTMIGRRNVLLKNTGAKTVFVRLNDSTAATVSDFPIASGATYELRAGDNSTIYSIGTICAGADVTTLDYLAFD